MRREPWLRHVGYWVYTGFAANDGHFWPNVPDGLPMSARLSRR